MAEHGAEVDGQQAERLIGQIVERFRIDRVLGRGGMGVVYAARHVELHYEAALKTLLPASARAGSPDSQARFLTEAQALSLVSDEGLVRIFNFGRLPNGTPYIIMELLSGQTLRQLLEESPGGRLLSDEALSISEQAAATLAVLHQRGVIHRDIKPENIMLAPDRLAPGGKRVKLFDFGIAKLVGPMAPTLTHEPLGTPPYMSPEGCRNEPVTGKADVYSLGCVLYEMLCGRPPYQGGDAQTYIAKHVHDTPRHPRALVRGLPRPVDAFVMQLLARSAGLRPTMHELVGYAQQLRLHPQGLYWMRARWGLSRLRDSRRGRVLAYALIVPVLLYLLLSLVAFATLTPSPGLDRLADKLLFWRSSTIRIPEGRLTEGSTNEELDIAVGLANRYAAEIPSEASLYRKKYIVSSKDYFSREQPAGEVAIPAFEIDRYEATNEQFADFLTYQLGTRHIFVDWKCPIYGKPGEFTADYSCVYAADTRELYKHLINEPTYGGIKFEEGHFTVDRTYRHRPVVAMTWRAADEYCRWRYGQRGRLPTEMEWEYVARRGGRRFPWGDEPPWCEQSVLERCGRDKREYCKCESVEGRPALPDVGTSPLDRSYDGVMDLGGSVSEWTADWFHARLPASPAELRRSLGQTQSQESGEHNLRVIRGGAWTLDFLTARGAARFASDADRASNDVGVRCVRDLSP